MIYTITCNPALDYMIAVENLALGMTNRAAREKLIAGGKGINVSVLLRNLGVESKALGFVAGFTGDEIERQVQKEGLACDFIRAREGLSRINIKLQSNGTTEVNGKGPVIGEQEIRLLMQYLEGLKCGDVLVLSGSIPVGVSDGIYADILSRLAPRGILCVVDATGKLLLNALPYSPFLIKPNHHELGEIFGVDIKTKKEAAYYGAKLKEKGARNVLVSMGGSGAVLIDDADRVHQLAAPVGKVINDVGAGDSMVAGFVAGWMEQKDYAHAFRMSVASGSASAFSEALATKEMVYKVYEALA